MILQLCWFPVGAVVSSVWAKVLRLQKLYAFRVEKFIVCVEVNDGVGISQFCEYKVE